MKKIISILLAAAMVLAFAACGNNSGNNGGNDAAVTDPLEVLSKTWSSLPEEDKFPAAGGDNGSPVDDKPGKFDISDTDNLDYMLSFPAGSVDLIDSAASISPHDEHEHLHLRRLPCQECCRCQDAGPVPA